MRKIKFDEKAKMERGKVTFCEECRREVYYSIYDEWMTGKLKGETYEYIGKVAHCNKCGKEVYVLELHDINLQSLQEVYREERKVISLEKILQIPKKYGISKRSLSLLLGWGEQTFSRYCDGMIPTKQYSKVLEKIYEDPVYFKCILENNKENLKTSFSYEKSKKTVELFIKQTEDTLKMEAAAAYIIDKCEDITPLILHKALYYIQGFYYAFNQQFFFLDDCEMLNYEPIYRKIYNKYKKYIYKPKEIEQKESERFVFSDSEKAVLDSVIENFCCYSGKILKKFIYDETSCLKIVKEKYDANLILKKEQNLILKKEQMGKNFLKIKKKYNMETPEDIKNYSEKMFAKRKGILR